MSASVHMHGADEPCTDACRERHFVTPERVEQWLGSVDVLAAAQEEFDLVVSQGGDTQTALALALQRVGFNAVHDGTLVADPRRTLPS